MDENWSTVGDLFRQPLSEAVREVLRTLPESTSANRLEADLVGYLCRATAIGSQKRSDTHQFLADRVEQAAEPKALQRMLDRLNQAEEPLGLPISHGLAATFHDAFAIRRETGGKDDYIGARHVIVAAFTSRDPAIAAERRQFRTLIQAPDLQEIVGGALGEVLVSALEPGEEPGAWTRVLEARGLHAVARAMDGRAPAKRSRARRKTAPGDEPQENIRTQAVDASAAISVSSTHTREDVAPWRDSIAGFLNDNPWSVPLEQVLGGDAVADALARLIAAKDFEPPMAVGVFGAWGSGKSLLMRRIHARIEKLQAPDHPAYHDKIVQISFNAWHYVDAELWASLAGSIFEELDDYCRGAPLEGKGLLDHLTTARKLTLEAARALVASRQAAKRAEDEVDEAEARLALRRREFATSLRGVTAAANATSTAGATWYAADTDARKAVQATYGRSLEEMGSLWTGPEAALDSLRKDHFVWLEVLRSFGVWRTALLLAGVGGATLALPLLEPSLRTTSTLVADIVAQLEPIATAATVMVSTAALRAGALTRRAASVRDAVVAAATVYSDARTADAKDKADTVEEKRKALQAARDELGRAQSSLGAALEAQAQADVAFAGDTPGGRLRSFVEARASAAGPYRSRQGLVSTIRRDFRDLAALMNPGVDEAETRKSQEADAAWRAAIKELQADADGFLTEAEHARLQAALDAPVPGQPFNRIVLYIDDLDRCPPAKVLEVLQAVHLLLAHSLFVVVVAVDVRWLTGALEKEYPDLIEPAGGRSDTRAAAFDYLEKIFQLPVWTEAIPATGASDLLRGKLARQLALEVQDEVQVEDRAPAVDAGTSPAGGATPGAEGQGPQEDAPQPDVDDSATSTAASEAARLELEPAEIDFLAGLAERLQASPRRLVRLANTYRVARAGIGEAGTAELLAGGYRGLGLLLALSAAFPQEFPQMAAAASDHEDWGALSAAWTAKWPEDPQLAQSLGAVAGFMAAEGASISHDVRPYIPVARRFSFRG